MKGRSDGFDDLIDASKEQLDLEVKDWKPHVPATKAVLFLDPSRNPRFPDIKRDEHNLILDPNDDIVHDRLVLGVAMSKQRNRFDSGDVDEKYDVDAAREIESEREQNLAKTHQKKIPTVNMDKDRGREHTDVAKDDYPLELDVKLDQVKGGVHTFVSMAKQLFRETGDEMNAQKEELDLFPNYEAASK